MPSPSQTHPSITRPACICPLIRLKGRRPSSLETFKQGDEKPGTNHRDCRLIEQRQRGSERKKSPGSSDTGNGTEGVDRITTSAAIGRRPSSEKWQRSAYAGEHTP